MHGDDDMLHALMSAAQLGDVAVIRSLLGTREDPGPLPLAVAVQPDARADSLTQGLTALHCCRVRAAAEALLDAGFPVDVRGKMRATPLHTCCESPEVVQLLLERGADVNATTVDGSSPAEWATVADAVETMRVLAHHGADVNAVNDSGNTCLHLVQSTPMVQLLLELGARVSAENDQGLIPLETAAERKGEPEAERIAALLLDVSHDRGLRNRQRWGSKRSLDAASDDSLARAASASPRLATDAPASRPPERGSEAAKRHCTRATLRVD